VDVNQRRPTPATQTIKKGHVEKLPRGFHSFTFTPSPSPSLFPSLPQFKKRKKGTAQVFIVNNSLALSCTFLFSFPFLFGFFFIYCAMAPVFLLVLRVLLKFFLFFFFFFLFFFFFFLCFPLSFKFFLSNSNHLLIFLVLLFLVSSHASLQAFVV